MRQAITTPVAGNGLQDFARSRPCKRAVLWQCFVVLVAVLARIHLGPFPVDDAHITFRYAANLAQGRGLIYNPGEKVLGTTTPAYAMLLAAARSATGSRPETTAFVVGVLADGAAVWLIMRLARRLIDSDSVSIMAGMLYGFSPLAIRFSLNGMETSLAVAWLIAACLAWTYGRRQFAIVLSVIGVLIRPEFLLLFAVLLWSYSRLSGWRAAVRSAVYATVVLLPWVVWAQIYYGSILPSSMVAKAGQIYVWGMTETVAAFLSNFAFLFIGYPLASLGGVAWQGYAPSLGAATGWGLAGFLALLQGLLAAAGIRAVLARRADALPVFAFPIAYVGGFLVAALRHVMVFDWYLALLLPAYILAVLAGVQCILPRGQRSHAPVLAAGLLLLCQTSGLSIGRGPLLLPKGMSTEREDSYRQVALRFAADFREAGAVAAPEIGALGYYSEARILDTAGLISPEARTYYPLPRDQYATNYALPAALVLDLKPEFVVTMEVFVRKSLMRSERFLNAYTEIYRQPTGVFGNSDLLVFRRIGS